MPRPDAGGRNRPEPRAAGRPSRTIAARRAPSFVPLAAILVLVLAGCGGLAAPPSPPTPGAAAPTPTPRTPSRPATVVAAEPCAGGRLMVGDLRAIDEAWRDGLAAAGELARTWRADARLVSLRVACQPLESGFRWQGRYYAESAQAFFVSDSGQTEPAEVDPAGVPALPSDDLAFRELQRSLARAGYDDDAQISPTGGVTVRMNDPDEPFGPPDTPQGVVYHVAIEDESEVRDLFVSGTDWLTYLY